MKYCDFDMDLEDSNDDLLRNNQVKEIIREMCNHGFQVSKVDFIPHEDDNLGLGRRLQVAGMDVIAGDSKDFYLELKTKRVYQKSKSNGYFALEILHDFYWERFNPKDLGWPYKLSCEFLFWFEYIVDTKEITQTLFLDARKIREWYIKLLVDNGVNIYVSETYKKLLPSCYLAYNGKKLEIKYNQPTTKKGFIRNQSDFIWIIPYHHLKDCFVKEYGFGQRRLTEYF